MLSLTWGRTQGYIFLGQNRDFISHVDGQDCILKNTHGVNYRLDTVKLTQSDSNCF